LMFLSSLCQGLDHQLVFSALVFWAEV